MADRVVVVAVSAVRYGEPTRNLWCDRCALPSAFEQVWAVVSGMNVLGHLTSRVCSDCGHVDTSPCSVDDDHGRDTGGC